MARVTHYRWGRALDAADFGFGDDVPAVVRQRMEARLRPILMAIAQAWDRTGPAARLTGLRLTGRFPDMGWVYLVMSRTYRDKVSRDVHTWYVMELGDQHPEPAPWAALSGWMPVAIDGSMNLVFPGGGPPPGWPKEPPVNPALPPTLFVAPDLAGWGPERPCLLLVGGQSVEPEGSATLAVWLAQHAGKESLLLVHAPTEPEMAEVGPALARSLGALLVMRVDDRTFERVVERSEYGERGWLSKGWMLRTTGPARPEPSAVPPRPEAAPPSAASPRVPQAPVSGGTPRPAIERFPSLPPALRTLLPPVVAAGAAAGPAEAPTILALPPAFPQPTPAEVPTPERAAPDGDQQVMILPDPTSEEITLQDPTPTPAPAPESRPSTPAPAPPGRRRRIAVSVATHALAALFGALSMLAALALTGIAWLWASETDPPVELPVWEVPHVP